MALIKLNELLNDAVVAWKHRVRIADDNSQDILGGLTREEKIEFQNEVKKSLLDITVTMNKLKAPIKAINELKKLTEAYKIKANNIIESKQLSIYDYKIWQ